MEGGGKP